MYIYFCKRHLYNFYLFYLPFFLKKHFLIKKNSFTTFFSPSLAYSLQIFTKIYHFYKFLPKFTIFLQIITIFTNFYQFFINLSQDSFIFVYFLTNFTNFTIFNQFKCKFITGRSLTNTAAATACSAKRHQWQLKKDL